MLPKKQIVERAFQNGTIDKVNQLLSAAHILNIEANNLIEWASDLLADEGLQLGTLKKYHSDFVRCADRYFSDFATLIHKDQGMNMFKDVDEFDKIFREWAKI